MELNNVFQRIDNEIKVGDIKDACSRAGVTTQVYFTLKKRNHPNEITPMEQRVLSELIGILDGRKAELAQLIEHANRTGI